MLKKVIAGAALLCSASFVNAAIIETTQTIDVQTTDFDQVLTFDKFDDMSGSKILESVFISYEATLVGDAAFENTGSGTATISLDLSADFFLSGPLGLDLTSSIMEMTPSVLLSQFDGTIDFDGTSGFSDSYNIDSGNSMVMNDAAALMFFTGPGTFDLNFEVIAESFAAGAGNAVSQFGTSAGSDVTVRYTYSVPQMQVSAPASLAIVGIALLAFARLRRS